MSERTDKDLGCVCVCVAFGTNHSRLLPSWISQPAVSMRAPTETWQSRWFGQHRTRWGENPTDTLGRNDLVAWGERYGLRVAWEPRDNCGIKDRTAAPAIDTHLGWSTVYMVCKNCVSFWKQVLKF